MEEKLHDLFRVVIEGILTEYRLLVTVQIYIKYLIHINYQLMTINFFKPNGYRIEQ